MKKYLQYLLLFVFCTLPSTAFAVNIGMLAGGAAGDAYDDLLMLLEFEDGSDADQTYTATTGNGDYCVAGTANYCDTADEGDGALSNLVEKNGTLGFDSPTNVDEWRFGSTADDHFNTSQGTVAYWVYINSFSSGAHVWGVYQSTTNESCHGLVMTGPEFRFKCDDASADFTHTTAYGSFATSTWYFVVNKYDLTLGVDADWISVTVLDSGCSQLHTSSTTNSGADNVIPWVFTDDDGWRPGGAGGTARDVWLDTISAWNTTTRTAAELCALTTSPK